jgi:hypothetical protein
VTTTAEVIAGTAAWGVDCCDALAGLRDLPDGCVQCCLTSPPFFALRSYLPAGHPDKGNEIGLEDTPSAYMARLVEVFKEVKRVLHPTGLLLLNLGDGYAAVGKSGGGRQGEKWEEAGADHTGPRGGKWRPAPSGYKSKDLLGIPWLVAFALRADGWYLRCAPPWVKDNCIPESVRDRLTTAHEYWFLLAKGPRYFWDADAVRVPLGEWSRQALDSDWTRRSRNAAPGSAWDGAGMAPGTPYNNGINPAGRNLRTSDVFYQGLDDLIEAERAWLAHLEHVRAQGGMLLDREGDPLALLYATYPCPPELRNKHFALFNPHMITPLLKAATSERGCCPACGAPWVRQTERRKASRKGRTAPSERDGGLTARDGMERTGLSHFKYAEWLRENPPQTLGWQPSCACPPADAVPCLILDCFAGSGTVGLVARRLGRRFVGFDLSREYVNLARERIEGDAPLFNGAAPAPAPAPPPGRTLFDSPAPEED